MIFNHKLNPASTRKARDQEADSGGRDWGLKEKDHETYLAISVRDVSGVSLSKRADDVA